MQRIMPMNSLGWIVGHLANHEQQVFLVGQGLAPVEPGLNALVGSGQPASTPPLDEMMAAWEAITSAIMPSLAAMSDEDLLTVPPGARPAGDTNGTHLLRIINHYWFHIGEGQAIRQMLDHTELPRFIGPIGQQAPFRID